MVDRLKVADRLKAADRLKGGEYDRREGGFLLTEEADFRRLKKFVSNRHFGDYDEESSKPIKQRAKDPPNV